MTAIYTILGLIVFFILLETFLVMLSMPRVFIVRKNGKTTEYMMKKGTMIWKNYEKAHSFGFYNPTRHYWRWKMIQTTGDNWRFKRIHLTETKMGMKTKAKVK